MKKKLLAALLLTVAVTMTGCGIKQINDTITVEAGENVVFNAKDFFNVKEEQATQFTFDVSNFDNTKVGEYEVVASFKDDNYTIKVIVEDTTMPDVVMAERFAFVNDASKVDVEALIDSIYDASEYETTVERYEEYAELTVVNENQMEQYMEDIPDDAAVKVESYQETLSQKGTTEVPVAEGVYKTVMAVTDAYGNVAYEPFYMVLDKTGASIEELPDAEVVQEDVTAEPTIDVEAYNVTDNVDGKIAAEDVNVTVEKQEEQKYLVTVSYTDRAGNESTYSHVLTVVGEEDDNNGNSGGNGNNNSGGNSNSDGNGGNNGGGSGNGGSTGGNGGNGGSGDNSGGSDNTGGSDPVAEVEKQWAENERRAIEAGYYNAVPSTTGGYVMLVHGGDGSSCMRDYLASMGVQSYDIGGYWIDIDRDYYLIQAEGPFYPIEPERIED